MVQAVPEHTLRLSFLREFHPPSQSLILSAITVIDDQASLSEKIDIVAKYMIAVNLSIDIKE